MHWEELNTFCRQLGPYFRREGMTFRSLCDKEENNKESFKDSLTEDFSKISLLLERVKLPRMPIRRSWEIPIAWSTWSKKDLGIS
jgi:hypothetical protein